MSRKLSRLFLTLCVYESDFFLSFSRIRNSSFYFPIQFFFLLSNLLRIEKRSKMSWFFISDSLSITLSQVYCQYISRDFPQKVTVQNWLSMFSQFISEHVFFVSKLSSKVRSLFSCLLLSSSRHITFTKAQVSARRK